MVYLLDSDAAKKLAQYDLLEELTMTLGCTLAQFAILPQLKFQLFLSSDEKALKKLGTQRAVDLLRSLVLHAQEILVTTEAANPVLELNLPDLDSGEKTLLAALVSEPENCMLTGDKRALIAIARITSIPAINELWPRILCLEECLYRILHHHDFSRIRIKIRNCPSVDVGISMIFGRSEISSYESVLEGITSYLKSVHTETFGHYKMPQ